MRRYSAPGTRVASTAGNAAAMAQRCFRVRRAAFGAWLPSPPVRGGPAQAALMFLGRCAAWRTERDAWLEGVSGGYVAGVTVKHPTERGSEGRTLFDRAAEAAWTFRAARRSSRSVDCWWRPGPPRTCWLRATPCTTCSPMPWPRSPCCSWRCSKNAERRAEHAIQGKLDRLAEAMLAERREDPDDGAGELEEAVGMHDEV